MEDMNMTSTLTASRTRAILADDQTMTHDHALLLQTLEDATSCAQLLLYRIRLGQAGGHTASMDVEDAAQAASALHEVGDSLERIVASTCRTWEDDNG